MVLAGRRCGKIWDKEAREVKGGVNSLLTASFSLSGLILAFTFGMSANRLEKIRKVVEEEVNDIGTAILRADLYPDSVREGLRADFKDYLEAVISFYDNTTTPALAIKAKDDAHGAELRLWARATRQSKEPDMLIPSIHLLPALNSVFDIATSREIILKSRVPDLIIYMLFICVLATCFIGGLTSNSFHYKDWIVVTGFALLSSMVVYTTLDLSRPMRGVIKERAGQEAIVELRRLF